MCFPRLFFCCCCRFSLFWKLHPILLRPGPTFVFFSQTNKKIKKMKKSCRIYCCYPVRVGSLCFLFVGRLLLFLLFFRLSTLDWPSATTTPPPPRPPPPTCRCCGAIDDDCVVDDDDDDDGRVEIMFRWFDCWFFSLSTFLDCVDLIFGTFWNPIGSRCVCCCLSLLITHTHTHTHTLSLSRSLSLSVSLASHPTRTRTQKRALDKPRPLAPPLVFLRRCFP